MMYPHTIIPLIWWEQLAFLAKAMPSNYQISLMHITGVQTPRTPFFPIQFFFSIFKPFFLSTVTHAFVQYISLPSPFSPTVMSLLFPSHSLHLVSSCSSKHSVIIFPSLTLYRNVMGVPVDRWPSSPPLLTRSDVLSHKHIRCARQTSPSRRPSDSVRWQYVTYRATYSPPPRHTHTHWRWQYLYGCRRGSYINQKPIRCNLKLL